MAAVAGPDGGAAEHARGGSVQEMGETRRE